MAGGDRVNDDINQGVFVTALGGTALSTIGTARRGRGGGKVGTR